MQIIHITVISVIKINAFIPIPEMKNIDNKLFLKCMYHELTKTKQ